MNDFLSPAEIDLALALQQEDTETGVQVTSGVKDAFVDTEAQPILTYIAAMLPSFLKTAFGIPSGKSFASKLFGTKAKYDVLLEAFLDSLEEKKVSTTEIEGLRTALAFPKLPLGPKAWQRIAKVLHVNKTKINRPFSPSAKLYLQRLINIVSGTEIDEEDLQFIQNKARFIPDHLLSMYLKSIDLDVENDDAHETLKVAQKSLAAITKKYFKTASPSPEAAQLKNMQEKFPEKYKEWKKAVNATKKASKEAVAAAFKEKGYKIVDVKVAKAVLKELGIPSPIDSAFIGKVGIGDTPAKMFLFYTKDGKLLDSTVGHNVVMNPKYTKDNDSYYCTHLPSLNMGMPVKVYTADHRKKSSQKLHNGARESVNALEDFRSTAATDVKPILNGKFNDADALAALVCRVIDETAGRIGNAGSERDASTYGIHNLLVKHARKAKTGFLLKYIGKKGIPQEHKVEDPISVKAITKLITGRKPTQYIFSRDGERPISPTTVGMYLKGAGFQGSPHRFRKIWANKIFNEIALQGLKKTKYTAEQAKALFLKAVEAVATKLGQTEKNTSIRSYIDPVLMKRYWDAVGHKPPAVVQKVIDTMADQDPDNDD